ncbi:MAG: LemA family protein [Bacillota bacterium]
MSWILLGILILGVVVAIKDYNTIIKLENQVENAWSQIDVQLKRRHDLIPNLVEIAKGYMEHEQETLEKVIQARSQAVNASNVQEQAKSEGMLNQALEKLSFVVEDYPDLKANQNFLELQEELTATEDKISFARQSYNNQVLRFNNKIEVFPSNLVANMFRFEQQDFFEIEAPNQREAPEISFS